MRQIRLAVIVLGLLGRQAFSQQAAEGPPEVPPSPLEGLTVGQLIEHGQKSFENGDLAAAAAAANLVLRRDPENVPATLLRCDIAWLQGDADTARKGWLLVRSKQENEFRANFGLGRMYVRKRLYRQATVYLEPAEKVAPTDKMAEALIELAKAYRGVGSGAQAVQTVERALQFDAENSEAWSLLIAMRSELGEFDRALDDSQSLIEVAKRIIAEEASSLESLRKLHLAYHTRMEALRVRGEQYFRRNPDGSFSAELLPGAAADAARVFDEIVEVRLRIAELRSVLDDFDTLSFAEKAVEYQPDNPRYLQTLGALQMRTFQYPLAADSLLEASRLRPDDPAIRRQAIVAIERLLEIDPENEVARRELDQLRDAAADSTP